MESINSLSSRSLQYFVIAKKWTSDLEFYKFESAFLRSLLDNHCSALMSMGEKENIKKINNGLMELDVNKNQVECLLSQQITQLELMSEDIIPEDTSSLAGKQIQLEQSVNQIFSQYRELKKTIFRLIQKSIAKNKLQGQFAYLN